MRGVARVIVDWELLILVLMLPLLLFPTDWRGLALLVIPLFWMIRKLVTGRFFPATPDDAAIAALLLATLVSLVAVFDIQLSFPKIAGLVVGIAFFYAGVQHARDIRNGKYVILGLIFAAGTGLAMAGLMASLGEPAFSFLGPLVGNLPVLWDELPAVGGLTVNANELAGMLGWIVPLLTACTIGLLRCTMKARSWQLGLTALILAGMLLFNILLLLATKSRGGILSVLFALIIMMSIRFRWTKWLLVLIAIGTVGVLLMINFGDANIVLPASIAAFDELGVEGRLEIWSRAVYGLQDFPITGMSMNGFRVLVPILYPLFMASPGADLGHAHNHLLQAGLDLGIPGLIAYVSIWIVSAGLLWSAWKKGDGNSDQVLVLGLIGSLAAGWLFGVFDAIALGAKPSFLWWLLLALVVVAWEEIRKSAADVTEAAE